MTATTSTAPLVRFTCDDDEIAHKVEIILDALGIPVSRARDGDLPEQRRVDVINRICRQCRFTEREQYIFSALVNGRGRQAIANELEVSRATVKWHVHNILTKTAMPSETALLRLVLDRLD